MNINSRPVIILFVTSVFDDMKTGPATFARLIHKHFKKDGINFRIITSDSKDPDKNIITVEKTKIKSMIYWRLWKKTRETVRQFPEQNVIVHFNNAFPYLYFGALGDKTVIQVNDYYNASSRLSYASLKKPKIHFRHLLRKYTESHSLGNAEIILFNSYYARNVLIKAYKLNPEVCKVIYKSIDPAKIGELRKGPSLARILFIGSNYQIKGLDILLASLKYIPELKHLYIAGPTKIEKNLQTLINSLSSSLSVTITGPLDQTDLYKLMEKSDLLVIPARFESLGVSVIEALAKGLPVITSGEGGLKEVLEGYPEFCFDKLNLKPEILGRNIQYLLGNYEEYQQLFIEKSEGIMNKFNVRKMIDTIYTEYGIR